MYSIMVDVTFYLTLTIWGAIVVRQLIEFGRAFIEERNWINVWAWSRDNDYHPTNGRFNSTVTKWERSWDMGGALVMTTGFVICFLLSIVWPITWLMGIVIGMLWFMREKKRNAAELGDV